MPDAKSEHINVTPDALETIRVLAEDGILRLTPVEVNQLEKALDSEPEVVLRLRAFL